MSNYDERDNIYKDYIATELKNLTNSSRSTINNRLLHLQDLIIDLEGIETGLIILFGFPRAGKTYTCTQLVNKLERSVLLKSNEFDCSTLYEATESSKSLIERLKFTMTLPESLRYNYIIVDSIKSLIYNSSSDSQTKDSFRKGGISNQLYRLLNYLHIMSCTYSVKTIATISPSSYDSSFITELLTLLSGSCNYIYVLPQKDNYVPLHRGQDNLAQIITEMRQFF